MHRKLVKIKENQIGLSDQKHQGLDYEYRVVASEMLGRPLKRTEIVHHRDGNPKNNSPENLLVFETLTDHSLFHMYNCDETYLRRLGDGAYVVDAILYAPVKIEYECACCHKLFYTNALRKKSRKNVYCSQECAHRATHRCDWPSKEVLEKMVWEIPSKQIGINYGVSDKTVERWCRKYGIAKPYPGYWQQKLAGKI
jgi:hypothetical protein